MRPTPMSKTRRWAALMVLSASLLVLMMDMTILNIALPEMAAELRPTATQQLWIVDVYSLVLAGLLVPWAGVADRWGRKRMLLLGYTIFALASLLVLFANSAELVIAIRVFLGIGGAMIMPNTLSLIRVIFVDTRERATALAVWAAVAGLGGAVGPLVGGALLEAFSWHAAFLINVPLMVVAIGAVIYLLPESRVAQAGPLDLPAAVASMIGMVALVWGIKTFGEYSSLLVSQAWLAIGVAALSLGWFTRRCLTREHPLLDLGLFRSRPLSAGVIAALGSTVSMSAALLLLAQWLQLVDGATPIEAGLKLLPVAVMATLTSLAAPRLAERFSPRAVLASALIIAGVGMGLIALGGSELSYPLVATSLALVGTGSGALAIASAFIMMGSPEEKAGNAGAIEESSYEVGAVLGVASLGSVAALVYRGSLQASDSFAALQSIDASAAEAAQESFGAAMDVATTLGLSSLASDASQAFVASLQGAGVAGGLLMAVVGTVVFLMVPRGTTLDGQVHH